MTWSKPTCFLNKLNVELNSSQAVKLILNKRLDYHPLVSLIRKYRKRFKRKIIFSLSHIRRSANMMADHLTKISLFGEFSMKTL